MRLSRVLLGLVAQAWVPAAFWVAAPLAAQLRPLDPLDWGILGPHANTVVVGSGFYAGQRASLAGTKGRLLELGAFRASWSLNRVALELSGTALRVFREESRFATPLPGVGPPEQHRREDTGDYRVSTIVQLTHPGSPEGVALRFGVRLPTTDDVRGLERDQTDFFTTLAGRLARGPWSVVGEIGLGINGTRDLRVGQVDPMLFALSASWDFGLFTGILAATGQHDTRPNPEFRGTEDLGEGRVGVRVGTAHWVDFSLVRGWTPTSPDVGLSVAFGVRF